MSILFHHYKERMQRGKQAEDMKLKLPIIGRLGITIIDT
jgi:hypothetical protein